MQLTESVSPAALFEHYVYLSGVSRTVVDSARAHARDLIAERVLNDHALVIEAASNDGTQLRCFAERGIAVLGIEPARNLAAIARSVGVPTRAEFFDERAGAALAAEGVRADIFLAKNVLAHVPDPVGFVRGIGAVLAPGGIAEIEVPYLIDLIDTVAFDTIYHEHLSYFSVHALDALISRAGLRLTDVHRIAIHGGSLRLRVAHDEDPAGRARVEDLLAMERERGVCTGELTDRFAERVHQLGEELRRTLTDLRAQGHRIAAYGASAKGATLLNTFGLGPQLDYVVDRAPTKHGHLTPGTHLPILPAEHLLADRPAYALLLAWNHRAEILSQEQRYRDSGGRFIVPVPTIEVL